MFAQPLKIQVPQGAVSAEEMRQYISDKIQDEASKVTLRGKKTVWVRKSPLEGAFVFIRKNNIQVQPYFGELWMVIIFALGMIISGAVIGIVVYMLAIMPKQQAFLDKSVTPKVYDFLREKGIQFS